MRVEKQVSDGKEAIEGTFPADSNGLGSGGNLKPEAPLGVRKPGVPTTAPQHWPLAGAARGRGPGGTSLLRSGSPDATTPLAAAVTGTHTPARWAPRVPAPGAASSTQARPSLSRRGCPINEMGNEESARGCREPTGHSAQRGEGRRTQRSVREPGDGPQP